MASLLGGIIALVLGTFALLFWFGEFIDILKGTLPVLFILGGVLAAYLGAEELKDRGSSDQNNETDELKNEVRSLKEELKGLREQKSSYGESKEEG